MNDSSIVTNLSLVLPNLFNLPSYPFTIISASIAAFSFISSNKPGLSLFPRLSPTISAGSIASRIIFQSAGSRLFKGLSSLFLKTFKPSAVNTAPNDIIIGSIPRAAAAQNYPLTATPSADATKMVKTFIFINY